MSGLQEILLILLIVAGLFVIPRMMQRPSKPAVRPTVRPRLSAIPGRLRLAMLASAIWLGLAAGYFEPWRRGWEAFVFIGAGPLVIAWGVAWVIRGFRSRSR